MEPTVETSSSSVNPDVLATDNCADWVFSSESHAPIYKVLVGNVIELDPELNCTHLVICPKVPFDWDIPTKCVKVICTQDMFARVKKTTKFHWRQYESLRNDCKQRLGIPTDKLLVMGEIINFKITFVDFIYDDIDFQKISDCVTFTGIETVLTPQMLGAQPLTTREQFMKIILGEPCLREIIIKRAAPTNVTMQKNMYYLQMNAAFMFIFNLEQLPNNFIIIRRDDLKISNAINHTMLNGHMHVYNMKECIGILVKNNIPFVVQELN